MSYLDIGLSAIRANQVALQTVGNNITNAGTDGYHRQQVQLVDRLPGVMQGLSVGSGVDAVRIDRQVSAAIERSLLETRSHTAELDAVTMNWRQIETVLLPGSGSISAAAFEFFSQLDQLAGQSHETVRITEFLQAADALAHSYSDALAALDEQANSVRREIEAAVPTINALVERVAELDERIRFEQARGREPNDLLDRRDQLLGELAGWVDVEPRSLTEGAGVSVAAGGRLLLAANAGRLELRRDAAGDLSLGITDSERAAVPVSGRLAGLFSSLGDLQQIRDELTEWFSAIRESFDGIQATGLGTAGPFASLTGSQAVANPNVPLADTPLGTQLVAGSCS
ncbi:MAG: flagellar basal body protein [Planctomycetaceae bacterium]